MNHYFIATLPFVDNILEIDCGIPVVENANIQTLTTTTLGSVVTLQCDSGYSKGTTDDVIFSVMCQGRGEWTGAAMCGKLDSEHF